MTELHENLHKTRASVVTVLFSQVEEVIGKEKANELALAKSALTEKPNKATRRTGELMSAQTSGLATYNRKKLVEAMDEAVVSSVPRVQTSFGVKEEDNE